MSSHPTGADTGLNLKTVVRRSEATGSMWDWPGIVISESTISDPYHTQGSIGADRDGYVHVAYNMHNMPWQYAVSRQPNSIKDGFVFKGEKLSEAARFQVKVLNKTPFPGIGSAAIPGNQVTYPAFFRDANDVLYVTYRYAVKPKRPFSERVFGAGIARYSEAERRWESIGGQVSVSSSDADMPRGAAEGLSTPFAMEANWAVYLPRLAFDNANKMHVVWFWREGGAGREVSNPSYAFSGDEGQTFVKQDGSPYALPIGVSEASGPTIAGNSRGKYDPFMSLTTDTHNIPYALLQEYGGRRFVVRWDQTAKNWSPPSPSPSGATVIVNDHHGSFWAFASGIQIFRSNETWPLQWQRVHATQGFCHPKVYVVPGKRMLLLHSQSCDLSSVRIESIEY
jgi:hypothetical protein